MRYSEDLAWTRAFRVGLVLAAVTLASCSTTAKHDAPLAPPLQDSKAFSDWGIEPVAVRTSAAGYLLDFRYRVVDAEKAVPLLKRDARSELIVEKNGAKLYVPTAPRVGPLRQSSAKVYPDRNYFVLFANPGKLVNPGDKVTIMIGEFKAEHLIVEGLLSSK